MKRTDNIGYTEITFEYNGKKKSVVECKRDYNHGTISYEQGVINQINALLRAGAVVKEISQY